jgi:D-aminopeptidase
MVMATPIKNAATANVTRIPVAMASGCAVAMSVVAEARANTVPIMEVPVTEAEQMVKAIRENGGQVW